MEYFEPIDPTTEKEIWKYYDKSLDSMKRDIETLKNWLFSQPHLPHILNNDQISAFLLMNKGSVEKAKPKIDMYFTFRTIYPNVFQNSSPFCDRVLQAQNVLYYVPLPKLCADLTRIVFIKIKDYDITDVDPYACIAHFFNVIEVRLFEDKCVGHSAVIDMENCQMGHIMKLTPSIFKCLYTIGSRSLTVKLNAIHLINAPSFIDQMLMIVKSVIKPKLANRIIVHKDIASMLESVDKNILPKEYGGNEKSLDELEEMFSKKFEEYREFFEQREHLRVNEELRPEKNRNDEFLGYYGNFQQLEVD